MNTIMKTLLMNMTLVLIVTPAQAQNVKGIAEAAVRKISAVNKLSSVSNYSAPSKLGLSKAGDPNLSLHWSNEGADSVASPSKFANYGARFDKTSGLTKALDMDSSAKGDQGKRGGQ